MSGHRYIYVTSGLGRRYSGGRQVLEGISLSFLPGAKIGVLGLNGAGKSTLLRIMAGLDTEYIGGAPCRWGERRLSGAGARTRPQKGCLRQRPRRFGRLGGAA